MRVKFSLSLLTPDIVLTGIKFAGARGTKMKAEDLERMVEKAGRGDWWLEDLLKRMARDLIVREFPRLCRGGSRSLTFPEVPIGGSSPREPPSARRGMNHDGQA